jgi:cytoskeletal protein RodZ
MESREMPAQLKGLFQFFLNIILVIGLILLVMVALIVVIFMMIYDAIFGGSYAK